MRAGSSVIISNGGRSLKLRPARNLAVVRLVSKEFGSRPVVQKKLVLFPKRRLLNFEGSNVATQALSSSGGEGNGGGGGAGDTCGGTFSVDDALESVGYGKFQNLLMLYLGLGWVADAMEVLLLSFLSPAVACEWNLSASEESWITGVVFVGMAFGAYTWGSVSDSFGRKAGFFVTSIFTGILGIASAFAPNFTSLLIFRGLVGFGLAGAPQMYAMFSEFVPTKERATKLLLFQMFWSVGAILEAGIAWYFMPNTGWRGLVLASSVPFVILSCLYPVVPESPRFLAVKGKLQEARDVLQSIATVNKTKLPDGQLVGPSIQEPAGNSNSDFLQSQFSQVQSLVSKPLLKTSLLTWISWVGASLGYYGIVILTTEVHTAASPAVCVENVLALKDSDFSAVLIDTAAEMPAFAVAIYGLEKIGRKWSIAGGFVASAVAMAPLLVEGQDPTPYLFCARLAICFVWGTIFVYTPEIYPTSVRAMGMGVASLFSRAGGLSAPFVSQQVVHDWGTANAAGIYILAFLASGASAALLPLDTKASAMKDTIDETEQALIESGEMNIEEMESQPELSMSSDIVENDTIKDMTQSNTVEIERIERTLDLGRYEGGKGEGKEGLVDLELETKKVA